jgi:hypothetical protein
MICRVGYALNPKKLRKSGSDEPPSQLVQTPAVPSSSSHGNSSSNDDIIWRGGGLADIVSDGVECKGVKFIPWNYETPLSQQVRLL